MRYVFAIIAATLVTGCAETSKLITDGTNRYCGTLVQEERMLIRGKVNAALEADAVAEDRDPHRIAVVCSGDQ